jgi:hypothetical protein
MLAFESFFSTISAYMLGLDEFDAAAFENHIDFILALSDGSLRYHFKDGSEKTWQKI